MRRKLNHAVLVTALAAFAVGTAGCSISTETIMGMEEGSAMVLTIATADPVELPLEGGVIMNIDVYIGILDLIFGKIDGDITVNDLLMATPPFDVLGLPSLNTEEVCVVLVEGGAAGGDFTANIYAQTASFDVQMDTIALIGNDGLAALLPDGGFVFPFDLQADMNLTLLQMLGMLTGTGDLTIEQDLDIPFLVEIPPFPAVDGHVGGQAILSSVEAFPTSQLLDDCIAFLNE
jgi:hypothetical protein